MDTRGCLWILVDSKGFWWILVDVCGFWWILMDPAGFSWILVVTTTIYTCLHIDVSVHKLSNLLVFV